MGQYWQELMLIAGLILLNAFFAAAEIAVVSTRPVRVRQLAERGSKGAQALLRLMADHSRFLATIQIGITLAGFLASASAAISISEDLGVTLQALGLGPGTAETVAVVAVTVVLSYFTLVLGELVPKRLALQAAERIALFVARPVEWLSRAAGPFTAFLTHSTNLVVRLVGGRVDQQEESISEEELRFYVEEHQELQEAEKRLISGVFDFGDRTVRQIMVPRPEMACLHRDATLERALAEVRTHGFWRYPVYGKDHDDIVGVVTVKDLVYHIGGEGDDVPLSAIMRPARFVPESKQALELLKEMQVADEQMAIVVDEYGSVAGLVTLEDLLEEIVGEVAEEEVPADGPVEHLLDGAETIEEVADRLEIELPPSPHYETLAGYILHLLGQIPEEGAAVEVQGWRLVVEQMEGRRIEQVRAIPLGPARSGGEEQAPQPEGQGSG